MAEYCTETYNNTCRGHRGRLYKSERKINMKSLITYILIFISILSIDMFGTEYYSIASGTFSDIKLDNWSTTRDGLGDNPTDYVTSGDIFYIQVSQTVYADGAVTFGAGVTLEVENGGVLKQNADFSIIFDPSATFRINAGGTLWQNSTDGASIVAGIEDWKPLSLVKVTNTGLFKSTDLQHVICSDKGSSYHYCK